jgi:benzoyl-CoA reductase subunit C
MTFAAPSEARPLVASLADPAAAILERARELSFDLGFASVHAWKAAHPGAPVVGYLPIYVPRPLFEAVGALPVAIFGGGDQIDVIRGDSFFQSYICHFPRSVLELGQTGALAFVNSMLFPSTCDVIRNLSGMWRLLYPSCHAAYLDLPQSFDPEVGGRFYAQDLARIAADLERVGASPLTDTALWRAIADENERRAALDELAALRRAEPWRLKASEAYAAVRAGTLLPAAEHTTLLRELLAAVKRREARAYDNVRVVVRGSFCEQPPLGLLRTLEKAGCDIVDDDLQLGLHFLRGPIEARPAENALAALARAYLERGTDSACRYIGQGHKGEALLRDVENARADGVVFAAASFCDPALLDQPMLEAALDRAGVPHTSFKFAENNGQFHTIREQAGAFSDSVKLWGGA